MEEFGGDVFPTTSGTEYPDSTSKEVPASDAPFPDIDSQEHLDEDASDEEEFEIVLDTDAADKGVMPLAHPRPNQYIRPGIAPSPPASRPSVMPSPSAATPSVDRIATGPSPVTSKPKQNVMDLDLDNLNEKPWRRADADITDYFNYGFNEDTWKAYCQKQAQIRLEQIVPSKPTKAAVRPSAVSGPSQNVSLSGVPSSSNLADVSPITTAKPLPVVVPPPGRLGGPFAHVSGPPMLPPQLVPKPAPSFKPPVMVPPAPFGPPGIFPHPFGPGMMGFMMPPYDRPPRGPIPVPGSLAADSAWHPGSSQEHSQPFEEGINKSGYLAALPGYPDGRDRDRSDRERLFEKDSERSERDRSERERLSRYDREKRDYRDWNRERGHPSTPPRAPDAPRTPPDHGPSTINVDAGRYRDERDYDRRDRRGRSPQSPRSPRSPPRRREDVGQKWDDADHKRERPKDIKKEDEDRGKRRRAEDDRT